MRDSASRSDAGGALDAAVAAFDHPGTKAAGSQGDARLPRWVERSWRAGPSCGGGPPEPGISRRRPAARWRRAERATLEA
ncbi:hypothetical protein [Haloechinothrix salitolerans]|uniref:Uncharacterized protein n=1 Tax=Haloechinothrix salitolerans TaxID=926830 RepID=A0ABW2BU35_9PSEU